MGRLADLISHYPNLKPCEDSIRITYEYITRTFENDKRLYICGNGGSAADALHIVGELVKSFVLPRSVDKVFAERVEPELPKNLQGAFPAFALVENVALASAYANDVNPDYVFAQQVYAYAREGDCVLAISTSGNSRNVLYALETACGRGAAALGLTGRNGGKMKSLCDVCICVPETETYKIQELHLPVYHTLCLMIEAEFFGGR
jgi:D-sedoheptulose 7-phosphate isomerase